MYFLPKEVEIWGPKKKKKKINQLYFMQFPQPLENTLFLSLENGDQ